MLLDVVAGVDGKRVFVKRGDEDGEAYSYVETTRRDAFAKDSSEDGKVRKVNIYAVTYCITPSQHRRSFPSSKSSFG